MDKGCEGEVCRLADADGGGAPDPFRGGPGGGGGGGGAAIFAPGKGGGGGGAICFGRPSVGGSGGGTVSGKESIAVRVGEGIFFCAAAIYISSLC